MCVYVIILPRLKGFTSEQTKTTSKAIARASKESKHVMAAGYLAEAHRKEKKTPFCLAVYH